MNTELSKKIKRRKLEHILFFMEDINYQEWKIISDLIEKEYKRVANKNVPEDTETLLENIMQELS